tara:strand:- start:1038 stop:1367 length:330 start_codon:yes stop_codon:yes gene_type:complete
MAAVTNLKIDQGASFSSDITVTNTDGDAVDLTGFTAEAKLAKSHGTTQTSFTTSITNASGGIITISLNDSQTSALEAPSRYVYDVYITKTADSTVTRVIEGVITVSPEV